MTLILAVSRRRPGGLDVHEFIRGLAPITSGIIVRPAALIDFDLRLARMIRRDIADRPIIADLALSYPSDLGGLGDFFTAVTLMAGSPHLEEAASSASSAGLQTVLVLPPGPPAEPGWVLREVHRSRPWGIIIQRPSMGLIGALRSGAPGVKILVDYSGDLRPQLGPGICEGADYEVVGRSVEESERPAELLKALIYEQKVAMSACTRAEARTSSPLS